MENLILLANDVLSYLGKRQLSDLNGKDEISIWLRLNLEDKYNSFFIRNFGFNKKRVLLNKIGSYNLNKDTYEYPSCVSLLFASDQYDTKMPFERQENAILVDKAYNESVYAHILFSPLIEDTKKTSQVYSYIKEAIGYELQKILYKGSNDNYYSISKKSIKEKLELALYHIDSKRDVKQIPRILL